MDNKEMKDRMRWNEIYIFRLHFVMALESRYRQALERYCKSSVDSVQL